VSAEASSDSALTACETVTVAFHGTQLDALVPSGISTSAAVTLPGGGDCAAQSDGEDDVVGTIVALSDHTLTLAVAGAGDVTFPQDSLTEDGGYTDGTVVDVTFDPTAGNSVLDVSAVELFSTATVDSLQQATSPTATLTATDAFTGRSERFAAADGGFRGLSRGDRVGILYWVEGGADPSLRADAVQDATSGAEN
jgi:hypothetical protein